MAEDQRAEPPDQPKTIELDAVQVLSQLIKGVATDVKTSRDEAAANFIKVEDRLSSQDRKLDKVVTEGIEANVRMTRFEDRLVRLENPSHPPPPPMTSTGVKALIDGHPSAMDLENQARLANALSELAEEKAKREALEAVAVTKGDVEEVVSKATAAQTVALVSSFSQNKKVQVIAGMIGTLVLGYLGRIATAPAPVASPVQMLTPVTIYADAGAPK